MALIIALLCGLFLFVKACAGNARERDYEKTQSKQTNDKNKFFQQYAVSESELERVEKEMSSSNQELLDLYTELLGEGIADSSITYEMLLWGILAKNGKIPPERYFRERNPQNLFSYWHDKIKSMSDKTHSAAEFREARLKFLKWYDKELRSHGMQYELMFVRPHYKKLAAQNYAYSMLNLRPISECDDLFPDIPRAPVAVLWEPIRTMVSNLYD